MSERRSYPAFLLVNHVLVNEIIISSHYEARHSDHMNDELIIQLIRNLQGRIVKIDSIKNGFTYYKVDPYIYESKAYRLVFIMEYGKSYIGVINAFRR